MSARIILFTGKGGVGKTSVAAASARRAADEGQRVLVASTDAAHSLGDVLDVPLGPDPVTVAPGLDALQIDGRRELTRHWGAVRDWATRSLIARGVDRVSADELTVPPGLEELLCLLRLVDLQRDGDHDAIIVDCAPSGETLRLLSFPDIAHWWLERIAPREDELLSTARPIARALLGISLPDGDVTDELHRMMGNLLAIRELLVDHERVSVRLVTTADDVVVAETRRTFTALSLYGVATDAIVVNRLFPADVGPYFAAWRDRQQAQLAEIGDAFAPLPLLRAPYFDQEVVGTDALDRLAAALYGGVAVCDRLHAGPGRELTVDGDRATVRIAVPFADREDVRLRRAGSELIVDVADRRRTVLLPVAIADYRPVAATVERGVLQISLQAPAPAETR